MGSHSVTVHLQEESGPARDRRLMTINELPDDVLVEIFFYVNIRNWGFMRNPWHALVHACRRWRYLVFASPRRLNVRLKYGGHRPMSEVLDVWPVLPVILLSSVEILPSSARPHPKLDQRWDNRIASLESEQYNRICEIRIHDMPNSRWERFVAAMRKPFPELTHLEVFGGLNSDVVGGVLPDSFLGGTAPRLRELWLRSIPFPSIPTLLLSANGLVTLDLWDIPHSGYISPDAMATALSVMTRLETLHLGFRSPRSHSNPASRPLPPPTRFVFAALTELMFKGVHEYLEDFLARIDAPLLYDLYIVFFMALNFYVPQLHRLIGHAEEFKAFHRAVVLIFNSSVYLTLYPKTGAADHRRRLGLQIYRVSDGRLSSLAQVRSLFFPLISTLEELELKEDDVSSSHWNSHRNDSMENVQWLELLDPFTALKNLYLTHAIAQRVCGALQELSGKEATEVLPALRNLFVLGVSLQPVQEAMVPFVAARQLSGHPVAIDHWRR